jgi:hypothetical protein
MVEYITWQNFGCLLLIVIYTTVPFFTFGQLICSDIKENTVKDMRFKEWFVLLTLGVFLIVLLFLLSPIAIIIGSADADPTEAVKGWKKLGTVLHLKSIGIIFLYFLPVLSLLLLWFV